MGDEQIAQYRERHTSGTMARLALELMLNIAARRHDAHLIGRQHLRDGKLSWRPNKTSRTTGKLLTIRVLSELQAALDAMPPSDALTFLLTDRGRPFASAAAFGNKFADWVKAAGLQPVLCDDGRVRSYRAHGLRKAACKQLAHDGCNAIASPEALRQWQQPTEPGACAEDVATIAREANAPFEPTRCRSVLLPCANRTHAPQPAA